MSNQLTHRYKSTAPGLDRRYVLTLTHFAGEMFATISSQTYSPSGYANGGSDIMHIQNKRINGVPKDLDGFIKTECKIR